jgi:hypothetical protein
MSHNIPAESDRPETAQFSAKFRQASRPRHVRCLMHDNKHYLAVSEFYGTQHARRSQIPLIAHIDEGLLILDAVGSSSRAKEAFCVHPLLQDDGALRSSLQPGSVFRKWSLDPASVAIAMEYRSLANAYLSHHCRGEDDRIPLSVLEEVNHMLIADKVQNRKDFEVHHHSTHENTEVLVQYFNNWLRALGISEARYRELVQILAAHETATD